MTDKPASHSDQSGCSTDEQSDQRSKDIANEIVSMITERGRISSPKNYKTAVDLVCEILSRSAVAERSTEPGKPRCSTCRFWELYEDREGFCRRKSPVICVHMDAKIEVLAKRCKKRGGDCPCIGRCQAMDAVDRELGDVANEEREVKRKREWLESVRRRLASPMATLKPDFVFDPNLQPVIVFDGDEATFGYEDSNGEWIEQNVWPFNEDYVWADDCERLGFRVE